MYILRRRVEGCINFVIYKLYILRWRGGASTLSYINCIYWGEGGGGCINFVIYKLHYCIHTEIKGGGCINFVIYKLSSFFLHLTLCVVGRFNTIFIISNKLFIILSALCISILQKGVSLFLQFIFTFQFNFFVHLR